MNVSLFRKFQSAMGQEVSTSDDASDALDMDSSEEPIEESSSDSEGSEEVKGSPMSAKKASKSGALTSGFTDAGRPWYRIGNRFASKDAFVAAGGIAANPESKPARSCPLVLKTGVTKSGRTWYNINGSFVSEKAWIEAGGKAAKPAEKKKAKKSAPSKKKAAKKPAKK